MTSLAVIWYKSSKINQCPASAHDALSLARVAKHLHTPESAICESLGSLIEKGFIKEVQGKVKRYSITPIKDVIKQRERIISELVKELKRRYY